MSKSVAPLPFEVSRQPPPLPSQCMFTKVCVEPFHDDPDAGHLPLKLGQLYQEFICRTHGNTIWSYGVNEEGREGWILPSAVAPRPVQLSKQIPPPPSRCEMETIDVFTDGSTDDRRGIGGGSFFTRSDVPYERSHFVAGYFAGSAAGELLGALCATQLIHEKCSAGSSVRFYTDSSRLVDYMSGKEPSSPEGQKLLPLITLLRETVSTSAIPIVFEWLDRKQNRAHQYAHRAMQIGRDTHGWDRSSSIPASWIEAFAQVANLTRDLGRRQNAIRAGRRDFESSPCAELVATVQ